MEVPGQLRQKVSSQPIKAGCSDYACNPSYVGNINRRIMVQPWHKSQTLSQKYPKQKGLGAWL
jgi:hypothetical protein